MSSVLLAVAVSIPIAVAAIKRPGSFFDRASEWSLTWLFSVPSFWLATVLLMVFANPDVLSWFPASGVKPVSGYDADAGFLQKVLASLPYLILPLICYTYSSLAFLSGTLKASLKEALDQEYSRTAKAKGLKDTTIVYRHALRNSLLPLITLSAQIFPAAIGGSVILESVFSIPGMGSEIVAAIQMQNYPMIVAVFTITSFLTMAGLLLADIGYAWADPRIRFDKK
jgi:peptide/nickel transport system permease protein